MRMPLITLFAISLCACSGGEAPKPAALIEAPQEAVSWVGDVSVRAHTMQTSHLSEMMARSYGIARGEHIVMLLVAVRQGADGQETALPATIEAQVTDLQGRSRALPMRELRTGDLLDYVGTVEVSLPETLRFDLKIVREGGTVSTMQFNRDFRAH